MERTVYIKGKPIRFELVDDKVFINKDDLIAHIPPKIVNQLLAEIFVKNPLIRN